jgi:ADP-heptose:LPS heptosyltransferase
MCSLFLSEFILLSPTLVINIIVLLRANALGDFIFSLPALAALRAAYSHAEIVLLGLDWHCQFLSNRPSPIDRVISVPKDSLSPAIEAQPLPASLEEFFQKMQQHQFDLAIQIYGGGRYSNPFVQQLGAKLTIGLKAGDAPSLDRWVPYDFYQSEILRYLEVVSLLGIKPTELEPIVHVTESDQLESEKIVPISDRPLAVLHPGASDPRRHWSVDRFAKVGDALAQAGAQIVITGSQAEQHLTAQVATKMQASAQDVSGQLSLNGLTGLLSRCKLVVANDTGPLHLATAVGTRTVGIYWCGNLITAGPLTRSRHHALISWRLNCPTCGLDCTRHTCRHPDSFVDDVQTEDVMEAALEFLLL